jgi:hypothetical protein
MALQNYRENLPRFGAGRGCLSAREGPHYESINVLG